MDGNSERNLGKYRSLNLRAGPHRGTRVASYAAHPLAGNNFQMKVALDLSKLLLPKAKISAV
jgi:hypothetical protein